MTKFFYLIAFTFFAYQTSAQVRQVSIGASNVSLSFNAVKYDPNDGGTIQVGYVNDPLTGTGNDCFLVKLNASGQIVWQKIIPNNGDDFLLQVIVCVNGDYVATGQLTQDGIARGFACRVNKTNGNIIWASKSALSSSSETFYDVVETAAGNIALTGWDRVSGTNTFIALLHADGSTVWSKSSSYDNTDFARTINQLPNGNLVVGACQWVGYYNAIIMELKESDGSIVSENSYTISEPSPNLGIFLNSLVPVAVKMNNGIPAFDIHAFTGCCGEANMCIYAYDQVTRQLSGNIYYHSGNSTPNGYAYTPLGTNDYLLAQGTLNPTKVYVSRITNNTVVYDRLISSSVNYISDLDTTATGAVYAGQATYNTFAGAYNLFSPRVVPSSDSPCVVTNANTLILKTSILNPTAVNIINLFSTTYLTTFSVTSQSSSYILNNICSSSITNKPPVVKLTSPAKATNYITPGPIRLSAEASDPDGKIKSVDFYNGNTLIFRESKAPYSRDWYPVPTGSYYITAVATDNLGLTTTSAPVHVTVLHNRPPTVAITTPADGTSYTAPANVTLSAEAVAHAGKINTVKFYSGTTLIHVEQKLPYEWIWRDIPAGNYTITAEATDSYNRTTTSSPVHFTVTQQQCNAQSEPTFGFNFNGTPVANINNGSADPGESAGLTVCDGGQYNVSGHLHSSPSNLYNITVIPIGGILLFNGGQADNKVLSAAGLNGSAGVYTIRLADPNEGGTLIQKITPFSDLNNNGIFDKDDCGGEPIVFTFTAVPCNNVTKDASGRMAILANTQPDVGGEESLAIMPNPARDIIHIYASGFQQNKRTVITVLSASGVILKTLQPTSLANTMQVNVSSLAKGMYILRITNGNKIVHKQFVKL